MLVLKVKNLFLKRLDLADQPRDILLDTRGADLYGRQLINRFALTIQAVHASTYIFQIQ